VHFSQISGESVQLLQDVVEQMDTALTNAAQSSPCATPAKKSDICKKCVAQSPKLQIDTDRNQPRKKERLNHEGQQLEIKTPNWLKNSSSDESKPVLSLNNVDSSITVQINGQRTKMITHTGCKYNTISSQLHSSNQWNSLPDIARTALNVNSFNSILRKYCNLF